MLSALRYFVKQPTSRLQTLIANDAGVMELREAVNAYHAPSEQKAKVQAAVERKPHCCAVDRMPASTARTSRPQPQASFLHRSCQNVCRSPTPVLVWHPVGTERPFEVSAIESLCQDRAPRGHHLRIAATGQRVAVGQDLEELVVQSVGQMVAEDGGAPQRRHSHLHGRVVGAHSL